jgi:alcohol dehydrogenase (NADP+)
MKQLTPFLLSAGLTLAQSTSSTARAKGTQLNEIPILGLGTWHISDNGTNVPEAIASAIQSGYRHIDCAYAYLNQKDIGVGIKEGLKRTGLSRQDLWITGKLWNNRYVSSRIEFLGVGKWALI